MKINKSTFREITIIENDGYVEINQGVGFILLEKKDVRELINNLEAIDKTTIRSEMDADMEDSGMAQGEIESCLNHWSNKYNITRK